ncbi:MAG: isocitrate/isopropylmalate dehydrogenase family protein [Anaerolineae bacterium]|nr:isocitrate/isopropylmalate dehydrogenase family protein [Anaerolineae bacterium]
MTYRIGLIPGDGIGREVIPAAGQVLAATGIPFEWLPLKAGWACFQEQGTALPEETLAGLRTCHAALFGAVSSPSTPVAGYRSPIVQMRQSLDLYANLRPVRSLPGTREGIDLLIVRENTEGLYAGRERLEDGGATAIAERVITRRASARIGRLACQLAQTRRGLVTIVHKANILRETCGLFRGAVLEIASEFPGLKVEEMLVDTAALRLVQSPERFDVLVTTNLFGDILSDEAAALVGGLGLAPSGNVGEMLGIFEPVHGSAPDIAGKGIANPLAAILAGAMMLEWLRESEVASHVRGAVEESLSTGPRTPDLGGKAATGEVTAFVAEGVAHRLLVP